MTQDTEAAGTKDALELQFLQAPPLSSLGNIEVHLPRAMGITAVCEQHIPGGTRSASTVVQGTGKVWRDSFSSLSQWM